MTSPVRALGVLLKAGFQADAWRAAGLLGMTLGGAVGQGLMAVTMKFLVDGIVGENLGLVFVAAVGLGALQGLMWAAFFANYTVSVRMDEATGHLLQGRLVRSVAEAQGIAHHENPVFAARVERLRAGAEQLGRAGSAVAWNGGSMLGLVAVIVPLAIVHPLLLLLPVVAVPAVFATNRAQRHMSAVEDAVAVPRRIARGLFDVATTAGPAKEVRLFGLRQLLVERHASLWSEVEGSERAARLRAVQWSVAGAALFGAGYLAALGFVAWQLLQGRATPGDLMLTFVLAGQVSNQVAGVIHLFPYFLRTLHLIGLLVDIEGELRPPEQDGEPAPQSLVRGVSLERVGFRYPGTDVMVLENLDLHLPAGSTVALVGDNGAGKSTLVKLLSGLYVPTEGRILLDDQDLTTIDLDEWRARTAAGFQDFVRFELTAREGIGIGDLPRAGDGVAVGAALQQAGANDVITGLPEGWDTQLGRSFEGGHEPSGGQWQKLALGRAMMRPAPLLLVLDEPTSNLDAETEYRLFARYAAAARRVTAANGGITLLVTHRFSTVRMADLIVVLDDGRIVEHGTHADLLAQGGLYAELYELQARAYR